MQSTQVVYVAPSFAARQLSIIQCLSLTFLTKRFSCTCAVTACKESTPYGNSMQLVDVLYKLCYFLNFCSYWFPFYSPLPNTSQWLYTDECFPSGSLVQFIFIAQCRRDVPQNYLPGLTSNLEVCSVN